MDILIVGLLVLLSGIFSGLTLGFFSLGITSLERKIKLGNPLAKKVYPIRKNGNLLLCTLLLGNVAVNSAMAIFLGNIATGVVAGFVSTGLIVVFGEIIPQAVFSRHALKFGARSVWLVRFFIILFYPVAYPLSWMLDKALGKELATVWDKKEIEEIIRHHEDAEKLDADEERILLGALSFSDKTAKMTATPRPVVFALRTDQAIDRELVFTIKEKGFSRIPVFEENSTEKIAGYLLAKDLLGIDLVAGHTVGDFMRREVLLVAETIKLDDLLNRFLTKKIHLACTYDEYGSFTGVVTLEDIMEEILDEDILDEADKTQDLRALALAMAKRKLQE